MKKDYIRKKYGLARDSLIEYLSLIKSSKNSKDYTIREEMLRKVCRSNEEYDRATKCLLDILNS